MVATIVLVHGLWTDESIWNEVTPILRGSGYWVNTVQLPLTSLVDDIAATRQALEQWPAPVVVAGWSYGGVVVTNAALQAPNVTGLVYVAAFAPDEDESIADITSRFPPTALASAMRPTERGDMARIDHDLYSRVFGSDAPQWRVMSMARTHKPASLRCLHAPSGKPAWLHTRSWYQISEHDHALNPRAQRWMAERIGATTVSLPTGHSSPLSRPEEVAALITAAATTCHTPGTARPPTALTRRPSVSDTPHSSGGPLTQRGPAHQP
ncbi:pimeloyl-ACP methyl ester carboxylesterase [Streptomyces sp. SLBN-118]|uniref:alpha/beta fold hydrolase n=1 Tax=Streptomyces sp. SLBN-118 TaxID=2768454 RepID=UPI0011733014|nr:alpha/beta hydrolase [Streptomyces sp. SLBN-118]TQK50733.1 pimeloyl-ACP methyl ester carboxylesterase [Streptomyces sp. SLBN-118]